MIGLRNKVRVAGSVSPYIKKRMVKLIEENVFAGESDIINQALIELIYRIDIERKAEKEREKVENTQ